MGFEINNLRSVGAINSNMSVSPLRTGFGSNLPADTYQNTSVSRFTTENHIKNTIQTNPEIKRILKEMNTPVKLNMKELQELNRNHAKQTQDIATGIIANLPKGLRNHVDVKSVKDAAFLHDIGKVLIPAEVLNKQDKLNKVEKAIMQRHSELGYELLKNTDINDKTLHLIKYHHQNSSHTGHPAVKPDFLADIDLEILAAADKYSALLEKRIYKEPMSKKQALAVIYKDVANGNLNPFIFKALKDYSMQSPENLAVTNGGQTPVDLNLLCNVKHQINQKIGN